ncbi:MAG: hypothetical protein LBF70_01950, partial [Holosporales bacterium]|nr:hypothetical protein [Holosporales bacterium]
EKDFKKSVGILQNLGMVVRSASSEKIILESPSWRHDIVIEEDIIEEILRIIGYENIGEEDLENCDPIFKADISDRISDALIFNKYYEVKTFSFINRETAEMFASHESLINIKDPLNVDLEVLRPSIIPSHLKSIKISQNKNQYSGRIFELGKKYTKEAEISILTATIYGYTSQRHWRKKQEMVSVFDIKEDLEKILRMITCSDIRVKDKAPDYYCPGRSGVYITQKETTIATFGEIHPKILYSMGITGSVVCFELFLDNLPAEKKTKNKELCISQYQSVTRDFSFIVKKSTKASDILESIKKLHIDNIRNISIFDIHESENIGKHNKAIAIDVLIQSNKATLSENDISKISQKIIEKIKKEHQGTVRK